MKEYVVVPGSSFRRTKTLSEFFATSWDDMGTLKPKPTTAKEETTPTH